MKRSLVRVVVRVCAVLLIASILPGMPARPARAQSQGAQWTVLIYYAADNNLEGQLMRELNRLEMVGSTDQVNFVVLVDRSPQYWTGSENWSGARLFRLEKDNNLFLIASPVVRDLGKINTGSPDTLQRFIEWGVKTYPAQQYALVIANHGGGWQGASSDESSNDQMISLAGLGRGLDAGVRGAGLDKLDLLVFNACLMGEMEVWSLLAPYARYGVGSEEITYGLNGFPNAMRDLVDNPAMNARDLGADLVNQFADSYVGDDTGKTLTMSEVELERLPPLQKAMDNLSDVLIADVDTPETTLAAASGVAHSPAFADTDRQFFGMVDLRSFLLIVETLSKNPEVMKATKQVEQALQDAVVAKYAGTDVPSVGGLSFFFPTWPRLVQIYTDGYKDVLEPIPGAKQSPWVKFLNLYPDALKRDVQIPSVSSVTLAKTTISEGEQAEATATVGGIGLKEVDLIAGRVEGDALITVDSNRIVLKEQQIETGLNIPVWDPVRNRMAASWDGAGWVLSNGEESVRASVQATKPGGDTFAVPGYFRSVSGGNELEGEIQFTVDIETGESTYMGAFARQDSGLLGPYTFETGDTFVVKRQLINLQDGSVEEVKGGMLIVGESPLQLLASPVPSGIYQFGMRAVNLADDSTTQLAELRVDHVAKPVEYRSRSLSFVTQRPADWLVEETVGTVTFTPDDLSSVKAQIGVVPLARLGATGSQSLDNILPALLDTLVADQNISNVKAGEISDATLAGRDARRMDYTYELHGRGRISGSMVAFKDEAREEIYLSLSEAPEKTLADEQTTLDLVRDNIKLLPTIYVNRVYNNEPMRFSLSYKDYWQVIERPASGDVFFRTPSLDAALRIQERPGKRQPTAKDNDGQLAIYMDEWLKSGQELKVSQPVDVQLSTLDGRRIEYSYVDENGNAIVGTLAAVTTLDGRAYIIDGELDTTSAESDTLKSDVEAMQSSLSIAEPQASPVPNPGEGWTIYENQDLHFGLAYLDFLEVNEDVSDPEFRVVKFTYQDMVGVEVAVVPLSPRTPPSAATADKLLTEYMDKRRTELPDAQVGTLATMDLAGIPARGISYGWYASQGLGSAAQAEMEASALVAPTPYGFAYLVNVYMPISFSGDVPVDANVIPNLLATFTPLVQGLKPVSEVGVGGRQLRFYVNAGLGVSVTVPAAWKVAEQADSVAFTGTDEMGRPVSSYELVLRDEGQGDAMSAADMDQKLSELISTAQEESQGQLRLIGDIGDPADRTLGGLQGRAVEFLALRQGTDVVNYTLVLVQAASGQVYSVALSVPMDMADAQQETVSRVLDSAEFVAK